MPTEKILIVEDDQTTAAVLRLYLGNMGYDIVNVATTGRDAIEMAKSYQPDLVLMDIYLGKGLNGVDAAEIIVKHYHTPVVFVTSYADKTTLERAKSVEPLGYINKPLRETDLRTTIEFALAKVKPKTKKIDSKTGPSIHEILMSLYGLTRTEAKVVEKLVEYPEINFVAEALDIKVSTARTHLKRIYRKTDTNRQSVLLHKIVTGPAGLLINQDDKQVN
jgi:DNA-binding NarL/FixJ family response regulator